MPDQRDFAKFWIRATDDFDRMSYRLHIGAITYDDVGAQKKYLAKFDWVERDKNYMSPIPSECILTLSHDNEFSKGTLQQLFNDLWNIGLRPTGFIKNRTDQEKDDHIRDLRLFSFQLLNKIAGKENAPVLENK